MKALYIYLYMNNLMCKNYNLFGYGTKLFVCLFSKDQSYFKNRRLLN